MTTLLSGCGFATYFIRGAHDPIQALEIRMDPDVRRACLLVMLPGMLDLPDTYIDEGFTRDASDASRRCDMAVVDAHFGYYRDGRVRRRVGADIVRIAQARGYDEIWLVGISMGGLGAMLVAQDHPGEIRGVVLLAPFLGDPQLVRAIGEAGGLANWDAPDDADPLSPEGFDDAVWAWMQGYASHPEEMPLLYIGVGTEDSLLPSAQLLADVLPETQHGLAEGGHGWVTWRVMWHRLLRSPPWDPNDEPPRIDR